MIETQNKSSSLVLEVKKATLSYGSRTLWEDLNLSVNSGEFLAVLGPNGVGKSSLLKVILGAEKLTSGEVSLKQTRLGYVPQQKSFDVSLPINGHDFVRFGIDGNSWGLSSLTAEDKNSIERAIADVGATKYADRQLGLLSGGEQQRLRIAQALVNDPQLLLCDEPLLSLDLASQQAVGDLIQKRRKSGTGVIFVTHEINPILPLVDKVLYIVGGKWAIGTPHEVLNSQSLSDLYGAHIDVIQVHGRIVVINVGDQLPTEPGGAHAHIEKSAHAEGL